LFIHGLVGNFSLAVYGGLESADAFADSFTQLREFLRAKHEEGDSQDDEKMHGLKESFEHSYSSIQINIPCLKQIQR